MSIHNQKRKKYSLDDNYFKAKSLQSCYFAGLLAADGCLVSKGNSITLGLQRRDKSVLKLFIEETKANYPIKDKIEKWVFESSKVEVASYEMRRDLTEIYNLTPVKSLTLLPPNIINHKEVDSFICGYIDGDGSIFLTTPRSTNSQHSLTISILGTKEMLIWIRDRFLTILGVANCGSLQKKRHDSKNTYQFTISNLYARKIFKHFYDLPIIKLDRKWSITNYQHSISFINKRYISLEEKVNEFRKLIDDGKSVMEISLLQGKSYKNCHRFFTSYIKNTK